MKLYICFLTAALLAGCACQKQNSPLVMDGAYNMLSQTFEGNVINTTFTRQKQVKIYAAGNMMYVRLNPADSLCAFGVGTYTTDSGRVTENIFYSVADSVESNTIVTTKANITKTDSGYVLLLPEIKSDKGKISLKEIYQVLGTATKSPLDGCWKQVSGYSVMGKDTMHWADIQYKAFYAGNFAFGNVETIGGHKHAGISYGTFTMNGSTVKETITASTWAELNGQTFTVEAALAGKGAFTQTVIQKNGVKEVLVYERMR